MDLEENIFKDVRAWVELEVERIQKTAYQVARLDVLGALAEVADRRGYVIPEINEEFTLKIEEGRHPVVEAVMPDGAFIPNNIELDLYGKIVILTGPNMAGKSTILRQVGLITLLSHIGSYVPATRAQIPLVDRIFTRVGASDNLAQAQSTFMLEMTETASIIHNATDRSLVLLDEIGRGTSTYDGVSIAWAVTEYLHESIGAKTIFATHYHELTELSLIFDGVKNMTMEIQEAGEEIVFLRLLKEGGSDRSYGIHVARLAGLPKKIIERSQELLKQMEGDLTESRMDLPTTADKETPLPYTSKCELQVDRTIKTLTDLDLNNMSPREALDLLFEMKEDLRQDDES